MRFTNMRGAEFAELMAFLAVAEVRSFRRAAQRLSMSPSALSHSIRSLEQRLGAQLLNRTTRSVAPTEAGQTLFERLHPTVAEMNNAVRDIGAFQSRPSGVVRVNTPRIAARLIVAPRLAGFRAAYPGVRLDLIIDDSMTDVVAKGFDAGIRSGTLVHQDMVAVKLTPNLRMAVIGSPAYFEDRALPQNPRDLQDHVCLTYRWQDTGVLYRWRFDGPDGVVDVNVENAVTVNDTDFLLSAALGGVGLAFLPESFVEEPVACGQLVRVLEEWCKPFSGFHLYYPRRSRMPAALRAFIDFMKLPRETEAHGPR
jgi:DNA-binding transcriptional LysR family regulator